MADEQQRGNASEKFMIVKLPDDVNAIPSSLKNLSLPSVIVDSQHVNFESMKRSQTTKKQPNAEDTKRRKMDLTCIVCDGQASGYNFNRITCHSCKEFFRRNALQPAEKLKCLQNKTTPGSSPCVIRFDVKTKCSRCRLTKCFELGMRKDFLMTSDQKSNKQKRIEENRRLRSSTQSGLTEEDRSHLQEIEEIYRSVLQTSPSPLTVFSFEKVPDPQSAFIHAMNIDNFIAVRMINFLRAIKDFTSLDERDRLTLVKYNLGSACCIESLLTFNFKEDICYFDQPLLPGSIDEETFVQHSMTLYRTCYGEEALEQYQLVFNSFGDAVAKDGRLVLLLVLITVFLRGWSIYEDQAPVLIDRKQVFAAEAKYIDLFFRSLLEKFSYDCAARRTMRCVATLLKLQTLSLEYDPFMRSLAERIYINPLMKSLLHL